MTFGEVAFASMRRRFADFVEHERGVRANDDPKEIHDMRVAGRRLRAALSFFSDCIPEHATGLRAELKWVAGGLGEVRDLDVQLERLTSWANELAPEDEKLLLVTVRLLEERRASARIRLLEMLDSMRYMRLVGSFTAMLQVGPPAEGPAAAAAAEVAPGLLKRRHRAVRRRGDRITRSSDPTEFHALRIRCKRFRYALEFLAPLAPRSSKKLIRRLVALQDALGDHQDAQVAIHSLRELAEDGSAKLPPGSVFLLGRMAERYERIAEEERARFAPLYSKFRSASFKRVRREIEASREAG
jgi:CHAD domain-containing protein